MAATTLGTPVQQVATPVGEKEVAVNISLPPHVHKHFLDQAKGDFRSINQFLKIKLLGIHKAETAMASGKPNGHIIVAAED